MTDSRIVGIVESYEYSGDKWDRATLNKAIKEKKQIGAKVVGYCVFILLNEENSHDLNKKEQDYLFRIMKQMAIYFKTQVINIEPHLFDDYKLPVKTPKAKPQTKNIISTGSPAETSKQGRTKKNILQIILANLAIVVVTVAACIFLGSAIVAIGGLLLIALMDRKLM